MDIKVNYEVNNIEMINSPSILVYRELLEANIENGIEIVKDVDKFRPHVKTNKMAKVCQLMIDKKIEKFKASTLSEVKMLCNLKAKDILLSHQLVGPKIFDLIALKENFPDVNISSIIDDYSNSKLLNDILEQKNTTLNIFIDINVGMNRTGINMEEIIPFYTRIRALKNLRVVGFHIYDGHIRESNIEKREEKINTLFNQALQQITILQNENNTCFTIVAGGSPSFSVHAQNEKAECSPGTFVFWDNKYKQLFQDLPFKCALLVITRVISILDDRTICLDLGHKSIASENNHPRVNFLEFGDYETLIHSEEHMVIRFNEHHAFKVGDVLYGIPDHVCPTVALHEYVHVIEQNIFVEKWNVTARNR